MLNKTVFLVALLTLLITVNGALAAWWDTTTYNFGYKINSDATGVIPISVNDTHGVGNGDIIWTLNSSAAETKWVACSVSGCKSGDVSIGNSSSQTPYENETSGTGVNTALIWGIQTTGVYHFHNGATDASIYGNDGTWEDGAKYNTSGVFGTCAEFNSTNDIVISDAADNYFPANMTISLWTMTGSGDDGCIVCKDDSAPADGREFEVAFESGSIRFYVYKSKASYTSAAATKLINDNVFHHVVTVYTYVGDGSSLMDVYIDGIKNVTQVTNAVGNMPNTATDLNIGARETDASRFRYKGLVEEVRLYNRTLSSSEVLEMYYNGINNLTSTGAEETVNNLPYYWGNITDPASPQEYGINNIEFNVSWNSSGTIENAWVTHDLSGVSTIYYMTNLTATLYNYTFPGTPAAGSYSYAFYANTTDGGNNNSATYAFTISKQNITLALEVNGTGANFTGAYPNMTNVSAWSNTTGITPALYRNGTAVGAEELATLAYGIYNYSVYLSHDNYTAEGITRWVNITRGASGLSLTSSPSWSVVENAPVTITCSGSIARTLYRNGITVPNPYSTALSIGTYNFSCAATDSYNYTPGSAENTLSVVSGGFGCSNTLTFAFSKNVTVNITADNYTTFYFGDIISDALVKSDLSDIYASNNATVYVNGSYAVVGYPGLTNFTLYWGNYIANYSHAGRALSSVQDNLTVYDEENPYYVFTIYEEMNGIAGLPPNANTSISLLCANGSTTFSITDSQFTVAAFQTITEARGLVFIGSEQFSRRLLLGQTVSHENLYLTDASTYTVLQIPLHITDFGYWDAMIQVYKYGGTGEIVITEGYLDVEHKFDTYLIKDETYYIRIVDGTETRDVGYLYPAAAGDQYISITPVTLRPSISLISDLLTMYGTCNATTNVLQARYEDALQQTESVRIRIYNETNLTAWFDTTYHNSSNITVTINGVNCSRRQQIFFVVEHESLGNSPIEFVIGTGAFGALMNLGVSSWIYSAISFVLILFTGLIAVPKIRIPALIVMMALIAVLVYAGWFVVAGGVAALLIVFLALGIVYEFKRGGMN